MQEVILEGYRNHRFVTDCSAVTSCYALGEPLFLSVYQIQPILTPTLKNREHYFIHFIEVNYNLKK